MCLAIPSKVVRIEDGCGIVDVDGVRRKVNIQLLSDVSVGDYIIVHAGYGLHKIDARTANGALALLRAASSLLNGPHP